MRTRGRHVHRNRRPGSLAFYSRERHMFLILQGILRLNFCAANPRHARARYRLNVP